MDRRTFAVSIPLLVLLGCASQTKDKPTASGPAFSAQERALISDYYAAERARTPAREKPAQRAKAGDKLVSGQRPAKLPGNLLERLPPLSEPYTRLLLGADVILVNRDTHDILDVIPQVAY